MLKRIIRLAISLALCLVDWTRDLLRAATGAPRRGRWVVLYYHNVPMARTAAFARQMDAALRNAVPVSPAAARTPQGERCFSVTFDDALAEIEHTALPVLKARRIPAAVFVPTAFVGRKADWQMPRESRERDCQVMSFAQLRHLDPELIVLGSHTESHRHLSQLSQEELERELRASRLKLETET